MNGGFPDALSSPPPFIRSEYEERIHISIEHIWCLQSYVIAD